MREVYRINSENNYVEPVKIEGKCPFDCVEVHPNDSIKGGFFYKYKWVVDHWEEGLTQEEIDELNNAPAPLSEIEILKKQQADIMFELMMAGVL